MLLALAGIAVIAAFGAAGIAEWLRDSFSDEKDVAARLGLRQVTPVPVQKPRSLPDGETQLTPADCMIAAPLSAYAEAVRRLRIVIDRSLDRQGPASQGAVVMVTSPLSGDGKTTLSLALARAYAQAGRSTLLIDCDLATPNLHNLVGREPSLGLADYLHGLAGPAAIRDIISIDEASGVRLAMGAPGGNRPTEHLLAGPAFSRLIAAARQHFDVIVLDTPAIGEIADGLHVAALADIAVLALRWGHTGRGPAAAAAQALADFLPASTETVAALNRRAGWQRKAPQRGNGTRRIPQPYPLAAERNEANVIAR
jgi:Mrp family chromosome partitioning ATPase